MTIAANQPTQFQFQLDLSIEAYFAERFGPGELKAQRWFGTGNRYPATQPDGSAVRPSCPVLRKQWEDWKLQRTRQFPTS